VLDGHARLAGGRGLERGPEGVPDRESEEASLRPLEAALVHVIFLARHAGVLPEQRRDSCLGYDALAGELDPSRGFGEGGLR